MQVPYEFSPLDEIIPPLYAALIFAFPCPSKAERLRALQILQDGLSRTVAQRPYITGEIARDEPARARPGHLILKVPSTPHDIRIDLNDMTIAGQEFPCSYEELRAAGMPHSKLDARVLAPLAAGIGTTRKVITARMNFIPGGCLLTMCLSHAFTDAWGISVIVGQWAKNCRELQEPSDHVAAKVDTRTEETKPLSVRRSGTLEDYERLKHRPELWRLLGLDWKARDAIEPLACSDPFSPGAAERAEGRVMITSVFSFSPAALKRLKRDASPNAPDPSGESPAWISTKDAVAAFMWQHIMRARFPPSYMKRNGVDRLSIATVAVDGRTRLSPPIPPSYTGNVIFCCMNELPLSVLTSPDTSLAEITPKIRSNLEKCKSREVLSDAVLLAASIPDVRQLRYGISSWTAEELVTSSWADLPFYDMDWGDIFGKTGRMEFFRMPKGQLEGICFQHPRHVDGSVDIVVGLEVEQMKRLRDDKDFLAYVAFVSE